MDPVPPRHLSATQITQIALVPGAHCVPPGGA